MEERLESLDEAIFQPIPEEEAMALIGGAPEGCTITGGITYNDGFDASLDFSCDIF
jgi:hypothetical protein